MPIPEITEANYKKKAVPICNNMTKHVYIMWWSEIYLTKKATEFFYVCGKPGSKILFCARNAHLTRVNRFNFIKTED